MNVANTVNRMVCVTDSKGVVYHVPARCRNCPLPTIQKEAELPKELKKISG